MLAQKVGLDDIFNDFIKFSMFIKASGLDSIVYFNDTLLESGSKLLTIK